VEPQSSYTPEGAKPLAPPKTVTLVPGEKTINTQGLHLIEGFEGFSSCPYQDVTGVWTIGFGEAFVSPRTPCESRSEAEAKLRVLVVRNYEWAVHSVSHTFGQHAVDALDSFAYNLGAGIFVGSLRADLERHNYSAAGDIMLSYDHAGGQVLPGLRTRREAEVRLLRTPDAAPKPLTPAQRKALEHQINLLRVDIRKRGCQKAPYFGRGRYHSICKHWISEGNALHHILNTRS
jgi:GH24 family phage-related lysozyme (muramidase)